MKKKINIQFIAITIIGIIVTMLLVTNIFYNLLKDEVQQDLKTTIMLLKNNDITKDNIKDFMFEKSDYRITLIDTTGVVLYDNDVDINTLDNHIDRPEVKAALSDGMGEAIRTSETVNNSTFYCAVKLDNGLILRISREGSNIIALFQSVIPSIIFVIIIMSAITIIAVYFLTNNLIRPIKKIATDIDDYSTYSDISEYKELIPFLDTIKKQHDDILRAAMMRQEFTANVSHELKTPLTAISGYAELIENGIVKDDEVKHFSKEIRNNSTRLLTLINDIIRLSELDNSDEQIKFEKIDLYEIVKSNLDNIKMNAKKSNISVECSGMGAEILANKFMINELVNNLCDNAIRYNVNDGKITIEVLKEEGYVVFKVTDTGIGIPKEHLDRIFERFYRVDKSRSKETGGTGLGLSIVKHIVALHDAKIEVNSEISKGTCMKVTFLK